MRKNYYAIDPETNYLVKFHDAYRRYVFVRCSGYRPIGSRYAKEYPQFDKVSSNRIGRELIIDMFGSVIGYVNMDAWDTYKGINYL